MLACTFHRRLASEWIPLVHLGLIARSTKHDSKAWRRGIAGAASLTHDDGASSAYPQGQASTIHPTPRYSPPKLTQSRRVSPSTDLIEALRSTGHYAALPTAVTHVADVSHRNAVSKDVSSVRPLHQIGLPALSLQAILAAYTRARQQCSPTTAEQSLFVYSPLLRQLQVSTSDIDNYLSVRGYERSDLEAWLSVIAEEDSETAARRLISHSEGSSTHSFKPLPFFVPLLLLRRPLIDAPALRYIIQYMWKLLGRNDAHEARQADQEAKWQPDHSITTENHPIVSQNALVTAIFRLIRHAARWPDALVSITAMFTQHVKPPSQISSAQARRAPIEDRLSKFCLMYNRMLSLLARPSQSHPFHSVALHQRAQFDVVKAMAMHKPPLAITREGYRAITQMQLASVKSERERDWEQLKAKSWPPWKEAKTGLDAEKQADYGASRGLQAIKRAAEAGYGAQIWEKVAKIMSGWDLDGSPTILTRAFMLHGDVGRKTYSTSPEAARIWAARIKATRTVEEAWAGFLAYEDLQCGPNSVVYMAMFNKLLAERRRRTSESVTRPDQAEVVGETLLTPLSAGDSRNVVLSSDSPNEAVYIRSPVPALEVLADKWLSSGLKPSTYVVAFLIENAESVEQADKYLRHGLQIPAEVPHPLSRFDDDSGRGLDKIPERLINAYVVVLCHLALRSSLGAKDLSQIQLSPHNSDNLGIEDTPLLHAAWRLLNTSKLGYRQAWYAFVDALSRDSEVVRNLKGQARLRRLLQKYYFLSKVTAEMHKLGIPSRDWEFLATCRLLNSIRLLTPRKEGHHKYEPPVYRQANAILGSGRSTVQEQFYSLLSGTDCAQPAEAPHDMPRLTVAPHPIFIHTLIRTLGKLEDIKGIVMCLQWMTKYQSEISRAAQSPRNARKLLRWALVSARVFLDPSCTPQGQSTLRTADEESELSQYRSQGLEHLKEFDSWGGWPSDHEVHLYSNYVRSV